MPGVALATIMFKTASKEDSESLPAQSEVSQLPALSKPEQTDGCGKQENPEISPLYCRQEQKRQTDKHKNESSSRCLVHKLALRVLIHETDDNGDHWVTKRTFKRQKNESPILLLEAVPAMHTHMYTNTLVDSVQTWSPNTPEKQSCACFGRFIRWTNRSTG